MYVHWCPPWYTNLSICPHSWNPAKYNVNIKKIILTLLLILGETGLVLSAATAVADLDWIPAALLSFLPKVNLRPSLGAIREIVLFWDSALLQLSLPIIWFHPWYMAYLAHRGLKLLLKSINDDGDEPHMSINNFLRVLISSWENFWKGPPIEELHNDGTKWSSHHQLGKTGELGFYIILYYYDNCISLTWQISDGHADVDDKPALTWGGWPHSCQSLIFSRMTAQ